MSISKTFSTILNTILSPEIVTLKEVDKKPRSLEMFILSFEINNQVGYIRYPNTSTIVLIHKSSYLQIKNKYSFTNLACLLA